MAETKADLMVVPKRGWGIDYDGSIETRGLPLWSTNDTSMKRFTEQEVEAMVGRRHELQTPKYPSHLRAYGLWNVSEAQLTDPTWTPIPYRLLDDACTLFVMMLCPSPTARSEYWPLNFDSSGNPRAMRHRIGYGVYCHHGPGHNPATPDTVNPIQIETFLLFKRQLVFGGTEAQHRIGVTDGTTRDERLKLSSSDIGPWSYGFQPVPPNTTGAVNGQDFRLHFYFTHGTVTDSGGQAHVRANVNLRGNWFDIMCQQSMIPFLLNTFRLRQLPDRTLGAPTPRSTNTIPGPEAYSTRSHLRYQVEISDPSVSNLSGSARPSWSSESEVSSAWNQPTDRRTILHTRFDHTQTPTGDTIHVSSRKRPRPTFEIGEVAYSNRMREPSRTNPSISEIHTSRSTPIDNLRMPPATSKVGSNQQVTVQGPARSNRVSKEWEAKSIVNFFLQFDDDHPETDDSNANAALSTNRTVTQSLDVNTAVAPWKTDITGVSTLELQQTQATEDYTRTQAELKQMSEQLTATRALLQSQYQALTNKLATFQHQLSHQPIHTALQSTKDSISDLIVAEQMPSARWIARAIRTRLQREPKLEYRFDIDKDIPGLRQLLDGAPEKDSGVHSTTKSLNQDWWSDTDSSDVDEILPDITHL